MNQDVLESLMSTSSEIFNYEKQTRKLTKPKKNRKAGVGSIKGKAAVNNPEGVGSHPTVETNILDFGRQYKSRFNSERRKTRTGSRVEHQIDSLGQDNKIVPTPAKKLKVVNTDTEVIQKSTDKTTVNSNPIKEKFKSKNLCPRCMKQGHQVIECKE